MKLRYFAYITAGLAMLSLSSCKDFLDKIPDTRVYLNNVEQLRELMVDGYLGTSYACVGELSSDNVIDNNSPSDNGVRYNKAAYSVSDNQLYAWEDVDLAMDNDTPSGLWSGCYSAIAVANAVLEKVEKFEAEGADENGPLSEDDKAKLSAVKGEALLVRAYHHWVLCNFFCMPYGGPTLSANYPGIPYITKPETTVMPHYERGTLQEDYEKIEADLLAGLPLINDQFYEVPKYHFNRAAANAFAARFFLFKREYDKVVEYATAAFKGNDPATMMSTLWSTSNLYYISDIGRCATTITNNNVMMCFTSYTTWWRRFVYSTLNRYTCNREARRCTLQGPGPSWERCAYRNSKTNETFSMHPAFNGYCGSAGGQEYGSYFAGTCFEQFEYTDKISGIGYCHGIRAEFTTEETLLCRAEAYVFLGEYELAFQDLNVWDQARQKNNSGDDRMVNLSHANIKDFYGRCLDKYIRNVNAPVTSHYSDSIMYGIAKPIHIDEVCPSATYHLDAEKMPYLQCVQHFRRLELVHTGMRWMDIKRLGLEIHRKIGRSGTDLLRSMDPRYAIQIPYEAIAAGMERTDRSSTTTPAPEAVQNGNEFVMYNN